MKRVMLVVAALVPAACASQDQPSQSASSRGECFNARSVSGFSTVNRNTVRLSAGPSRNFDVDLSGPFCDQINWSHQIALDARPSSWICTGDRVGQGRIIFRDSTTRQRVSCIIEGVRRTEAPRAS